LERIRSFRRTFLGLDQVLPSLTVTLPTLLTKLYSDCQTFAEAEIKSLIEKSEQISDIAERQARKGRGNKRKKTTT